MGFLHERHSLGGSARTLPSIAVLLLTTFVLTGVLPAAAPLPALAAPLTGPVWTAEGNQTEARFGTSVAPAGDVNGDGFSDVIVGAYQYDAGQTDEGRAAVYLGSAGAVAPAPIWHVDGDQAGACLGWSVAAAGDVNGDGYGDVIVGAYAYDNGETDEGRAYVYLGTPSGISTTPVWQAEGNQAGAFFGYRVATAGDVNRDGYDDILVGAWSYDNGETDEGRAYL